MNVKHPPATRLATLLVLSGCIHLIGVAVFVHSRAIDIPDTRGSAVMAVRLTQTPAKHRTTGPASTKPAVVAPVLVKASSTALPSLPDQETRRRVRPQKRAPAGSSQEVAAVDDYAAFPASLPPPPTYKMSWPAANVLSYAVQADGSATGNVPSESKLELKFGVENYSLRFDGVMDPQRGWEGGVAVTSEGTRTDDGFAALRVQTARGDLPESRMRLNRTHDPQAAADSASPTSNVIVHDQASLILQLIGMAVQDPTQFESPVHFAVAASSGVRLTTFALAGVEMTTVPMGTFETWHLVQTALPFENQMEVWLTPALGWYPLQLKTTAPNGAVVMQRLLKTEALLPEQGKGD